MRYNLLGKTGMKVSRLSFGALHWARSFIRWMRQRPSRRFIQPWTWASTTLTWLRHTATLSETVLGKALKGIARERYYLSTKVGKYTAPGSYGNDELNYSRARIRASLDESAARLGSEYFDIIHIHDIEYQDRKHTEWALTEGYESGQELKREGRIGNVSFGIYPMDLWKRIFTSIDIDAALVHNHYCLNDTRTAGTAADCHREGHRHCEWVADGFKPADGPGPGGVASGERRGSGYLQCGRRVLSEPGDVDQQAGHSVCQPEPRDSDDAVRLVQSCLRAEQRGVPRGAV